MRKSTIVLLGIILFSIIVGILFYPKMPEKMATHWNARGEVDGYSSKLLGVSIIPIVLFGAILLFLAIPKIDPLKVNIEKFRKYYDGFIVLFSIFMLSIFLQLILWNLGIEISPTIIFPIGIGILFYYVGILCENAKQNWFIGIRTPWTLSNEKVWDNTHNIGAKLFKIAGALALIGIFFKHFAFLFVIIPVLSAALYAIVYSYFDYQKEMR